MTAVLLVPGYPGSELNQRGALGINWPIWINPAELLTNGLLKLQLAADGLSPGPAAAGAEVVPGSPLSFFYSPITRFLQSQGYDVRPQGYDWRISALVTAERIWPAVQAWLGNRPLYIVAHSHGSLVARALYGQMQAAGQAAQLARLICIAPPHHGSWDSFGLLFRQWWLYPYFRNLCGQANVPLIPPLFNYIDPTLPTWICNYVLLPWLTGWVDQYSDVQVRQVYDPTTYIGAIPGVTEALLQNALAIQDTLNTLLPTAVMYNIMGQYYKTRLYLQSLGDTGTWPTYLYTFDGDGVVPNASSIVPGVPQAFFFDDHNGLCYDPGVMALVSSLIAAGPVAGAAAKRPAAPLAAGAPAA